MESPFDVLGVDPDADEAEIVRTYRRRVKETHPDRGGTAREFQRVQAAYEAIEASNDDAEGAASGWEREWDPDGVRVEYINYDVLADHGWTLGDGELFERASEASLDPDDHGRLLGAAADPLLESAEQCGFAWPFACRGGACANCAVAVLEGELDMPPNHILSQEMLDRGIRLSCVGRPLTDELKVVYNVKHLPGLDELRLPSSRFDRSRSTE